MKHFVCAILLALSFVGGNVFHHFVCHKHECCECTDCKCCAACVCGGHCDHGCHCK